MVFIHSSDRNMIQNIDIDRVKTMYVYCIMNIYFLQMFKNTEINVIQHTHISFYVQNNAGQDTFFFYFAHIPQEEEEEALAETLRLGILKFNQFCHSCLKFWPQGRDTRVFMRIWETGGCGGEKCQDVSETPTL